MKIILILLLIVNVIFIIVIQFWTENKNSTQMLSSQNSEQIQLLTNRIGCIEWGSFFGNDLQRAEAVIANLDLGQNISRDIMDVIIAHWVYIPPFKSVYRADQEIKRLKRLNIDSFRIQDVGEWQNAISLAVFRDKLAAEKLQIELKNKGIASAAIGKRNLQQVKFVIREPALGVHNKIKVLAEQFNDSKLVVTTCARI